MKQKYISLKVMPFISLIIIILLIGIVQVFNNHGYNYEKGKYFIFFWVFSFDSIIWGSEIGIHYKQYLSIVIKWFEIVVFLVSLSSIISISSSILSGNISRIYGGVNYQAASYFSAFAFGLSIYYSFSGKESIRFSVFQSKFYQSISHIVIVLLGFCVIVPGGRGAFVLMIVYMLLGSWAWLRENKHSKKFYIWLMLILCILPFVLYTLYFVIQINESIYTGFQRAISFIDFKRGGFDLAGGSSGRDRIYQQAFDLISKKPFNGYGLFEYMYHLTTVNQYPHNFFLELLLQGGVFYFAAMVIFLTFLFSKLIKLIKRDLQFVIVLFLFAYPMTNLMFSGSYLDTPLFWYCVMIVFSAPKYEKSEKNV
ncbi:O-antigen ligase family protein [uncultured Sphaerochaeta sp.]|uniref:O-antigen ligase family protein n=1 Tax=uncultured Sphaerochaeta sp. TaxID=886478 RepID=UPI002A0A6B61|nr:O-antigen ligase family protein [uncultured Sphaerochaeta sp.]